MYGGRGVTNYRILSRKEVVEYDGDSEIIQAESQRAPISANEYDARERKRSWRWTDGENHVDKEQIEAAERSEYDAHGSSRRWTAIKRPKRQSKYTGGREPASAHERVRI